MNVLTVEISIRIPESVTLSESDVRDALNHDEECNDQSFLGRYKYSVENKQ